MSTVNKVNLKITTTRNNLAQSIKQETISQFSQLIVDLADLALLTKQAHWNMKGPNFIAVHEMLDGFRTTILDHQDTFAERIVQLGGTANATLQVVAQHSSLKPYPTDIHSIFDHLTELAERYAIVANKIRAALPVMQDDDAVDMLTGASRDFDKFLWFIEAHLS